MPRRDGAAQRPSGGPTIARHQLPGETRIDMFFKKTMLEDPWAEFEKTKGHSVVQQAPKSEDGPSNDEHKLDIAKSPSGDMVTVGGSEPVNSDAEDDDEEDIGANDDKNGDELQCSETTET
jgi:hypothetical protein